MARITKIKVGDQEVSGIDQQFQISREEWNEYKLLDGGTVRVKTSVQRIYRLVDDDGRQLYNANGDPHVILQHKTDAVATED